MWVWFLFLSAPAAPARLLFLLLLLPCMQQQQKSLAYFLVSVVGAEKILSSFNAKYSTTSLLEYSLVILGKKKLEKVCVAQVHHFSSRPEQTRGAFSTLSRAFLRCSDFLTLFCCCLRVWVLLPLLVIHFHSLLTASFLLSFSAHSDYYIAFHSLFSTFLLAALTSKCLQYSWKGESWDDSDRGK